MLMYFAHSTCQGRVAIVIALKAVFKGAEGELSPSHLCSVLIPDLGWTC